MKSLLEWLSPPVFCDEEQNRISAYVHWLLLALMGAALALGLTDLAFGVEQTFFIALATISVLLFAFGLLRRGKIEMASIILLLVLTAALTASLALGGNGIHDIGIVLYPILILIASFLLFRRGLVIITPLIIASTALVTFGEIYGWLPIKAAPAARAEDWVILGVILGLGALIIGYVSESLYQAIRQSRESQHAYALSNQMLREQTNLLAQSEERWRTLLQNIPDNILNIDLDGNILLTNHPSQDVQQALIGRNISDIVLPENQPKARAVLQEVLATGQPKQFETYAIDIMGRQRKYDVRIAPIKGQDQSISSLIIVADDITDRLDAEQSLAQRAQQLATLNKIGQAVSALRDLDGVLSVILKEIQSVLPLDAFSVSLYDPATRMLSFPLVYDSGKRWSEPDTTLDTNTLNGKVIETGQSFLVNYTPEEIAERTKKSKTLIGDHSRISASMIFVPMQIGEQRIGSVSVHSYTLNAYKQSDVALLEGAAIQIGIAIQNARMYENIRKRAEQLEALNQVGRKITSLGSLERALQTILEQMQKMLTLDVFYIGLYNPSAHTLSFPLMYDSGKLWDEPDAEIEPDGWAEQVLLTRKPFLLNRTPEDIQNTPQVSAIGDVTRISASIMVAPLELDNRAIGIISAQSYRLNAYTQEDLLLLSNAANQIATAIQNARLYEEAQHRAESMAALYEIGMVITSNLQPDGVLNAIYESCKKLMPLNAFYVATYDPETGIIAHPIFIDQGKRVEVPPRNIHERPGLSGYIITHKETVYIPDVLDPAAAEKYQIIHIGGEPTRSYLGVPLMYQDKPIGVISIQNDKPDAYRPENIFLLETISTQAAIALVNARLYASQEKELHERQQAEAKVRLLNAELERRVQERTAELEAFTYTVSHDLRAPLRSINGYSRIFMEEYGHLIPPEGHTLLERISNGARQMGILIDDLLTFSRLNRASLNKTMVDLAQMARDVFDELTESEDMTRITCRVANLPPAYADPTLIRQAITNLISNSLKFTRHRQHAVIEVGWIEQEGHTVYYVRDNGAGFNMEYANKLFGVFQRLHHQDEFEGTGVGLAIVQRIIKQHGGRIWAEGELNQGATFYFTLEAPPPNVINSAA